MYIKGCGNAQSISALWHWFSGRIISQFLMLAFLLLIQYVNIQILVVNGYANIGAIILNNNGSKIRSTAYEQITTNERYRRYIPESGISDFWHHNSHPHHSYYGGLFFDRHSLMAANDAGSIDDINYVVDDNNDNDGDGDLERRQQQQQFYGPVFMNDPITIAATSGTGHIPGHSSSPFYNNETLSITLNCNVDGFPIPKVYWRIDNITMMMSGTEGNFHKDNINDIDDDYFDGGGSDSGNHWPQYWSNLNAIVTIKNFGKTLIIGGNAKQSKNGNENYDSSQYQLQTQTYMSIYNNYHRMSSESDYDDEEYFAIMHQIQCLAINRFGSIISNSIMVRQLQPQPQGLDRSRPSSAPTLPFAKHPVSGTLATAASFLKPIPESSLNGKLLVHNNQKVGPMASSNEVIATMLMMTMPPYSTSSLNAHNIHQQQQRLRQRIHIQLYDEFVSRGNVAVLKCLVKYNNYQQTAILPETLSASSSSSKDQSSSTGNSQQWSSSSSTYHQHQSRPFHSQFSLINGPEYIFEWRIKNGPAASPLSTIDSLLTIHSNQTQGKYSAYPTGELHVRDVDEHDARRTYQCAVFPAASILARSKSTSSNTAKSTLYSTSLSNTDQNKPFSAINNNNNNNNNNHNNNNHHHHNHHFDQTQAQPLAESTFAQIILSGGEKDIYPPRIVHRLDEIYANEGQLDPLLIPCAAHSQPFSTYRWYWIPFGVHFDWETEIASLLLSQQKSKPNTGSVSSSITSVLSSFAMSIPSTDTSSMMIEPGNQKLSSADQKQREQRRQQLILSRLRSMDSTLIIPGPIGQANAGHYVAIVANNVGYDRCITTVNVRSSLSVRIEPIQVSSSKSQESKHKPPNQKMKSKIIRVVRGETIRLRCIVQGFPLTDVYWLHNTNYIANSNAASDVHQKFPTPAINYHYNNYGNIRSDPNYFQTKSNSFIKSNSGVKHQQQMLQEDKDISAIQHLDLVLNDRGRSGMYQCFASNPFETVQATIQIQVIDQPPSIIEHFQKVTVQPGESITLRCVSRAAPLAQIEWSLDRQPIPNSSRFRFGDFVIKDLQTKNTGTGSSTESSLLVSHFNVTNARIEDGGLYRCTAKNSAGSTHWQARVNVIGKGGVKVHVTNVTALAGTDLQLNCPYYGYPVQSISWFGKDGSQRKLPTNGRQHISPNGTLHISKINKKEDQGPYECQVVTGSVKDPATSRTKLYLNVITGPRIDNFTFAPNLEEGMRSVVMCAVIAGDPPIRISWLKDGQPLSALSMAKDRKIEMVNEFTSSITFTALKRKHAGRYTCIASNSAASNHHYADLKVNVAPVWLYEPKDIVTIAGQMLIINCQAEGIPEPQVRWKVEVNAEDDLLSGLSSTGSSVSSLPSSSALDRQNQNHNNKNKHLEPSTTDSNFFHAVISNPHMQILENGSLIIKEVNRNDNRRYMCSAFNGVGTGISTIIRLSVHFPPQFVNGYFEHKQIRLGETVSLICLVRLEYIGNRQTKSGSSVNQTNADEIVDMRWFKDTHSEKFGSKNDPGMSSTFSNHYHVLQTFEIVDNSLAASMNLSTLINNHQLNGKNEPPARFYATKLAIRHVQRSDTGVYLCTAHNFYGFIHKNFTVTVLEPPDRPEQINADEITSTTIKLTWPAPFDGNSAINEYLISYKSIDSTGSSSHSATTTGSGNTVTLTPYAAYLAGEHSQNLITFQLTDLIPATTYIVQVKAKNSIGSSSFSDNITVKTTEEPPNDVPTDITILPLNTRSLKISWRPPRKHSTNSKPNQKSSNIYVPPITGYYIGYRAQNEERAGIDNEFVFKTIKSSIITTDPLSPENHETFVLSNLKRATRYDIKVQAFNMAGAGPSSSEYQGKTLDFDVPSAPRIRALKANLSSIELMWSVQGEEPIAGFVISYKQAIQSNEILSAANSNLMNVPEKSTASTNSLNEWKTIKIDLEPLVDRESNIVKVSNQFQPITPVSTFQRQTYVLSSLKCGTKYYIYVNAYNSAGQGDPSEVIMTRTEGNMPMSPELVQDFLQPNITDAKIQLNKWKPMGCPIEQFEVEFRIYGEQLTNRKLIIKPTLLSSPISSEEKDLMVNNGDNDELEKFIHRSTATNLNATNTANELLVIELNNLISATWYELVIRAITEAGTIQRDYLFATLQLDGGTVAPITITKTNGDQYGLKSNQQQRSTFGNIPFVHSFRSSMFAQLHYIVPVSCTLVILFLVFVVVCAIQTNRNNFMFTLVANTRNRHHKVASGSKLSTGNSQYDPSIDDSNGMTLEGTQIEPSITNTTYCTVKEHIYGTSLASHDGTTGIPQSKLTCSGSIDELLDNNTANNNVRYTIRTDSCHSLGLPCEHGKNLENKNQEQQQQYPLYSLPVPYATSAVQYGANGGTAGAGTNSTATTTAGSCSSGSAGVRLLNRKPELDNYNHQQNTAKQFSEMYCDGPTRTFPFTLTETMTIPNETIKNQNNWIGKTNNANKDPALNHPGITNVGFGKSTLTGHQYELPFVFKNGQVNRNESTAF